MTPLSVMLLRWITDLQCLKHTPHVIPNFHLPSVITERVGRDLADSHHRLLDWLFTLLAAAAARLGILYTVPGVCHH